MARRRSEPMPVKYWSAAGIMLTSWCNARCASCYLSCGPQRTAWMTVDQAVGLWQSLVEASPHGCRVHLTGGEPFGDWPVLIEVCRRAKAERLGPLEKVETNAFWAEEETTIRDRLRALDEAGMGVLAISADPYHQQFVPIQRCRRLARLAGEVLGADRVQVRWRDWLADGCDTADLSDDQRRDLFAGYARQGRDRLTGRAAGAMAGALGGKSPAELTDRVCREPLLRGKHVHIGPDGCVQPGTCAGVSLGNAWSEPMADIWHRLESDHGDRAIVGTLARSGPTGLAERAVSAGFEMPREVACHCQLCWWVRRWLWSVGLGGGELAPAWVYGGRPRVDCGEPLGGVGT